MNSTTTNRHAVVLSAALAHAKHGLHIFPAHVPVFDKSGKCTGCTCEHNKRSEGYHQWLTERGRGHEFDPNYKCKQPGKCPAVSWSKKSTRETAQINKWWGKKWSSVDVETGKTVYFYPNIGVNCGKSGLLVLDEDAYKNVYGDLGDLLTPDEQETVKQLSGSHQGTHLLYAMPEGKAYGNATGDLPDGIDIRGVGGYIIVEPSLHKSGNRYEWLEGYSPDEIALQTVPQSLQDILDAAYQNNAKATSATFTAVTTEKPDLTRWRISKTVRELISTPGVVGTRSENDMKVCIALLYAGATPDDIRGVFQHNAIGTQGKYAERGDEYLALTIGKAQAFVAAHPRPDIPATIDNLLLWVRTHSFEPLIDSKFLASDGTYRTGSTDTKVADAILCEMKNRQRLTINIGIKRLGKLAGVGHNTSGRALDRLDWMFRITPDAKHGAEITLDICRLQQMEPFISLPLTVYKRVPSSKNDINEYSPRKADEPFLTGLSKYMRERILSIADAIGTTFSLAKDEYTFAGLGERCIRVIDAMLRVGAVMMAQELADETGMKLSSTRSALRKLEQHGIVEAEREGSRGPKVYSVAPNVWAIIEELAPNLRTYGLSSRREDKRLEAAQQWAKKGIQEAHAAQDTEQAQRLEKRFATLGELRKPHLQRLYPDLSVKDIVRLAYDVADYKRGPSKEVREQRKIQAEAHRETVRMIRELAEEFSDIDTPQEEIFNHIMQYETFDGDVVKAVLQSPKQMQNYETLAELRNRAYAGATG